ncbi:MAG TPA: oxygen-independent coproporphyrinogen III oxidase [Usitatibacteraceae bacterium]|nr:oxygen-independent coproporphyrinogen III oxidase [Usitatibacteraceae bacterium]
MLTAATPDAPAAAPRPQSLPAQIDLDLVQRFDKLGPRYTSYPTADRFVDSFGARSYQDAMQTRLLGAARTPLSLYVHLPFCNTICFYCGCNKVVTRDKSRAARYLHYLGVEIGMQAALAGDDRRVRQMHWGGGTPTFLSDQELRTVWDLLRTNFEFSPDGEYAIEIDPRSCSPETIRLLAELGFNRASFGVQDFDPAVQRAVNRIQPYEMTRDVIAASRANGFKSLNVDLIYGLPKQSVSSFADTVERVLELRPDRIALYSYAHLPQRFKSQRRILDADIPSAAEKLSILARAIDLFNRAGYIYIGMDHFALPDDELALAQRNGTLTRNFQGYTVGPDGDMLSFGVSAIGKVGPTYSQNARDIPAYYETLDDGRLPVIRGLELSADDLLRREIIIALMCQFSVSFESIEAAHGVRFDEYFAQELGALEEFESLGLVVREPGWIAVTPKGRFFVRAIGAVFDRYLRAEDKNRVAYSRII